MAAKFHYCCKSKSLNTQIREAEQQVALRHQRVTDSSSRLLRHLRQRITAPAALWLAGGVGFMFGELTQPQSLNTCSQNEQSLVTKTSVLSLALNFITLIHNLYLSLPLILIIKSYFDSNILSGTLDYRNVTSTGNGVVDHTDSNRQK